jgi:hypothetical protein
MSRFQYNGEDVREFPTISVTVNPGEQFDAPDGFTADGVVAASQSRRTAPAVETPSAPSDTTQGA